MADDSLPGRSGSQAPGAGREARRKELMNYAFGLTRVSLRDYFFASWLGMLPGTVMYVYIGSLIGDLGHLGRGDRQRTALEWTLYAVGLLATIMVTVYITRVARKALAGRISV